MFYREVGQFKTSYAADMAMFPIRQDRIGLALILAVAFIAIPLLAGEFMIASVMIPFLILALAAIGLNILIGYTGLISLGTGAFMGVGAYACYKLTTLFPGVNIIVWIVSSGLVSCAVGVLFGLPSLRIKGFYLAIATLAAQFFLQWCFVRVGWLYNGNHLRRDRGADSYAVRHSDHRRHRQAADALFRRAVDRRRDDVVRLQPRARAHRPLVDGGARHGHRRATHGHTAAARQAARLRSVVLLRGRRRRADGVPVVRRGRAGSLQHQPESFNLLFMVIIGGLGSLIGSFFGAALIHILPIVLRSAPAMRWACRSARRRPPSI